MSAMPVGFCGCGCSLAQPRLQNLFRSLARPSPSARPAARPRTKFFRAFTHTRHERWHEAEGGCSGCACPACRAWPPRGTLHSAMAGHCCGRGIRAWPCRLLVAPSERPEGGRVAYPPSGPATGPHSQPPDPARSRAYQRSCKGLPAAGVGGAGFSTAMNPPPAKRWPTISHPQKKEARRLLTSGLQKQV